MQPTVGNLVDYLYMTKLLGPPWHAGNDQTVLGVDHGLDIYVPLRKLGLYIYTHMPMDDGLASQTLTGESG